MSTATRQFSKHVSVPSHHGVRVVKAITINRPIAEVYNFWRHVENLPRFMRQLQSVTVRDDLHSQWAIQTASGKVLKWDSEIIERRDNEMVSWRSTPESDVDNAGSVWFNKLPNGQGTLIRVELKYVMPDKLGDGGAGFSSRNVESEIEEDLQRLKNLLETGGRPPGEVKQAGLDRARNTARFYENSVRENSWKAVATVAILGVALAILLGWRLGLRRTTG